MTPYANEQVAAAFAAIPSEPREGLLRLRELIFDVAGDLPNEPQVEETLKWGQPAYLTPKGSTIRLGIPKSGGFALFVHCQSRLIPDYEMAFPKADRIEGTRAVLFKDADQIDEGRHGWLIARALTYRQKK
jgi:hypothetical protein